MPSAQEALFNRSVADILVPEYERETGIALDLIACDEEFPDLVCESKADRRRVGIELVEIGLFFVSQENGALRRYEGRFREALAKYRPAYKDTVIRLQIGHGVVAASRPYQFPHARSRQADLIVDEFQELVGHNQARLLPRSAFLLRDLVPSTGSPAFPELLRHFDAVIVAQIPASDPGRQHPDDPVVDLHSVTLHSEAQIEEAVVTALRSKDKGPSYTCAMLVLHTLQADHKPYSPGSGFHAREIVTAAMKHLPLLKGRFTEVWLLNAYRDDGKRLYRVK